MFLPDLGFFPSRIQIPDPGVKKTLDSGSATQLRLEMGSAGLLAQIGDNVHYTLHVHPVGPVFIRRLSNRITARNLQGFALI
jgi:hypothetical protein